MTDDNADPTADAVPEEPPSILDAMRKALGIKPPEPPAPPRIIASVDTDSVTIYIRNDGSIVFGIVTNRPPQLATRDDIERFITVYRALFPVDDGPAYDDD